MTIIDPLIGTKIVYILGIANIAGLLLVFFSCRCLMGSALAKKLMQHEWYRKFYNAHCYYWWLFFVSVALHAALAILVYGNPFLSK